MMLIASCFICKLHGFLSFLQFFVVGRHLTRSVGKQTPAAPEVLLRDVAWSYDPLFWLLASSPTIGTRGSVG